MLLSEKEFNQYQQQVTDFINQHFGKIDHDLTSLKQQLTQAQQERQQVENETKGKPDYDPDVIRTKRDADEKVNTLKQSVAIATKQRNQLLEDVSPTFKDFYQQVFKSLEEQLLKQRQATFDDKIEKLQDQAKQLDQQRREVMLKETSRINHDLSQVAAAEFRNTPVTPPRFDNGDYIPFKPIKKH
ncbi:hypothetical protein ACFQ22_13075 [Lentilactobacillus raoultii]|uniref:Uncharacterized protein n=1 Tax=Lentilactobacillus raoultii TaxID=1987503 RepID=A0ABW3PG39_9LACO|nr:hypothetical protein [Lentilactobacillus raoultii]